MKKKPLTNKAGQVRELTRKNICAMRSAREVLPADLFNVLLKHTVGQRERQENQNDTLPTGWFAKCNAS